MRVGPGAPNEDPPPTACSTTGSEAMLPFGAGSEAFSFLWDTDHYVVAYSNPATGAGDIYIARLAADGSSMGPPVAVQPTAAASDLPNLLKTSRGYLVVWQEGSAGTAVYAHALGPDTTPVGSGVIVASTQSTQSRPVLAPAPSGQVAVAFMDSFGGKSGAQLALLDPASLAVTGPQPIAPQDVDGWPWIAGDGQTLGVAWSDAPSGAYDVKFGLVDSQGPSVTQPVSLFANPPNSGLLPRLIHTSFGFLSAWEDEGNNGSDNEIRMALVDPRGHGFAGGLVEEPNSGDANWPNMAFTGSSTGIVYYQFRAGRPQVYMSFIDNMAARVGGLNDLQVSNGTTGWSKYPDVVWTGTEFGVMYVDTRNGRPALWFQRVTCKSLAVASH